MKIDGIFDEAELIEYISLRLKLETIVNFVNSAEYSDAEKINFMRAYLKEVK